MFSDQRSLWTV